MGVLYRRKWPEPQNFLCPSSVLHDHENKTSLLMQTLSSAFNLCLIVSKIATHTLCVILLHSWLTWMHNNQPFFFSIAKSGFEGR